MQTKKNIGLRASHERWEKINQMAYARQISIQKLIDEAIDFHLFGVGHHGDDVKLLASSDRKVNNVKHKRLDRRTHDAVARVANGTIELMRLLEADNVIPIVVVKRLRAIAKRA
jgi:hypothetical protein